MNKEYAYDFWSTYLSLVTKKGARVLMGNPGKEFDEQAHKGEFDSLSDEEYYRRRQQAQEAATFWNHDSMVPAGKVLLEALANTPMSNDEMKEIIMTLVDASERVEYKLEEKKPEMSEKCAVWEEGSDGFDYAYGNTPFDREKFKWTPRLIYDYIGEYVYGQERARRAAAIMLYNHLQGRRRNMLIAGPTGCGKTEIWRTLRKKFPFIKIVNGPQIACDGWKGSYHVKDIFLEEPEENLKKLLVVVDEADKLFEPAVASGGTDFARAIQNEFLKVMDGDRVTFVVDNNRAETSVTVDCSQVSFVFCGSFETLLHNRARSGKRCLKKESERVEPEFTEEDLILYGNVRREIAGRIQQIVEVEPLNAEDFERIMESPKKMSPVRQLEILYQIHLELDPEVKKLLAEKAAESGLGCRYIRSRLQSMLDEQMFDEPEQKKFRLSLGAENFKHNDN